MASTESGTVYWTVVYGVAAEKAHRMAAHYKAVAEYWAGCGNDEMAERVAARAAEETARGTRLAAKAEQMRRVRAALQAKPEVIAALTVD